MLTDHGLSSLERGRHHVLEVTMVEVTMGCKGTVDAMTLMRFMVAWQAQVAGAVVAFCSLRTMSKMTVTRGALVARAVHA